VKIIVHGPAAGLIWDMTIRSWAVDEAVDIDDDNRAAVAWANRAVATGLADMVVEQPPRRPAEDQPRRSATAKK
jgi:hypothetical protein